MYLLKYNCVTEKYRKCPAASQLSKENIDADHEDQENEDYHICKKVLLEGGKFYITEVVF